MEHNEQRQRHLSEINAIVGLKGYTPENWRDTWQQLAALEQKAEQLAVSNALATYAGDWEQDREKIEQEIQSYFIHPENVIFNADPRGHAVKISGDYRQRATFTDFGGNIPIIPESLQ